MKDMMSNIKGRVKNAHQGQTPIKGKLPAAGKIDLKSTRVKKGPGFPRVGERPKTAQSRMGLNIGARVTRGKGR